MLCIHLFCGGQVFEISNYLLFFLPIQGTVSSQEHVMANPPEDGMVEVVSYTTETAKDDGQPGPAGYALEDSGSEPEFVSVGKYCCG
jgi:hypothetical protein